MAFFHITARDNSEIRPYKKYVVQVLYIFIKNAYIFIYLHLTRLDCTNYSQRHSANPALSHFFCCSAGGGGTPPSPFSSKLSFLTHTNMREAGKWWVGLDEFSLLRSTSLDTGSRRAKYLFGGNSRYRSAGTPGHICALFG